MRDYKKKRNGFLILTVLIRNPKQKQQRPDFLNTLAPFACRLNGKNGNRNPQQFCCCVNCMAAPVVCLILTFSNLPPCYVFWFCSTRVPTHWRVQWTLPFVDGLKLNRRHLNEPCHSTIGILAHLLHVEMRKRNKKICCCIYCFTSYMSNSNRISLSFRNRLWFISCKCILDCLQKWLGSRFLLLLLIFVEGGLIAESYLKDGITFVHCVKHIPFFCAALRFSIRLHSLIDSSSLSFGILSFIISSWLFFCSTNSYIRPFTVQANPFRIVASSFCVLSRPSIRSDFRILTIHDCVISRHFADEYSEK